MVTSARALTETEWQALLDIGSGLPGWLEPDPDVVERLVAMGLATPAPGGRAFSRPHPGRQGR